MKPDPTPPPVKTVFKVELTIDLARTAKGLGPVLAETVEHLGRAHGVRCLGVQVDGGDVTWTDPVGTDAQHPVHREQPVPPLIELDMQGNPIQRRKPVERAVL